MKKREKREIKTLGFTLTEMVVVIAIIIIILGIAVPGSIAIMNNAKKAEATAEIKSFKAAITAFELDMGKTPQTLDELVKNPGVERWQGPYLEDTTVVPKDPWKNSYIFMNPGTHGPGTYEIISYGADGQEGGEGINADISNWKTEEE